MRVRIVCYEGANVWILGKFALRLLENLEKLGIQADISNVPDKDADINHHIIYYDFNGVSNLVDTLMITHIDNNSKFLFLQERINNCSIGICMSNETVERLTSLGIDRSKLCYVNPAHDGVIKPKTKVIGLTCRVQNDGRKREFFLNKLAEDISPKDFSFKIMGDGWDEQIRILTEAGFNVEYHKSFNYDEYIKLIPSLDYYLYMGFDEGQMGFVDALSAGIETIVTPQGYHLDAPDGITHSFETYEDLLLIFRKISEQRHVLINSVKSWNWFDYTQKHVEIWEYLIAKKYNRPFKPKFKSEEYADGIKSVFEYSSKSNKKNSFLKKIESKVNLKITGLKQLYYIKKSALKSKNG